MTKITLDAEAFKVLASDTRLQILKSLDERPKTVSELARQLDLNKATVHEHLKQLLAGQLIKKNERDGRKWVYYALSWKGKSLLHPENTTVLVLLGLAIAGSAGAMVQLANWLRIWGMGDLTGGDDEGDKDGDMEAASGPADDTRGGTDEQQSEALRAPDDDSDVAADSDESGSFWDFLSDGDFWLFAALLLFATAAVVGAMLVKQRARGRTLEGSEDLPEAKVGAIKSLPADADERE